MPDQPLKFSFIYYEDKIRVGACCALPHNKLRKAEFADVSRWLWERHKCIVITDEQAQAAGLRWMGEDADSSAEPRDINQPVENAKDYFEKF